MSITALRSVIDEMAWLLAPLAEAAATPEAMLDLLGKLGWRAAAVPAPLAELGRAGAAVVDAIVLGDEAPAPQVLAAIAGLVGALDAIRSQPDAAFPDSVDAAAFGQTLARDLLDYCVVEHLLSHRYRLGRLLKLVGVIRLFDVAPSGRRGAYVRRMVDWAGAGHALVQPLDGLRAAYAWDEPEPRLMPLLSDVAELLESFGLNLSHFVLSKPELDFATAGAMVRPAGMLGLSLELGEALGVPPGSEAAIRLLPRPPTSERGPAIAILPHARLIASDLAADDTVATLSMRADTDLAQGFAVTLAPGREPLVEHGFLGGAQGGRAATFALRVHAPPPPGQPERVLVGAAGASRLSLHSVALSAGIASAGADAHELFVELRLDRLRVVVDAADADGLVAELLGGGLSAEASLGLRLSSVNGLQLSGGSGLRTSLPVHLALGPLSVRSLGLALQPSGQGLDLDVGFGVALRLGPVTLSAEGVGFRLAARFPDPPVGNLGPLDLDFGVRSPTAIGIAVDVPGVISGGGFVAHDAARHLYSGVLQLAVHEKIQVSAFGLLATRLPDGSKGYSLLVFITAEGFKPIPLGLGFTLLGIGGMVGVHRTFDETVLRAGLKAGTLGQLLFPRDPVANAAAIIRAVDSAFPARRGSYLLGLLLRIGWFTPTLVLADLAVIVEFGARRRLLVLGRVRAALPSAEHAVLRLQLDAIGVIDLDAGTAAIDAVLVDSRLLERFAITGAAALRTRWSRPRSFALAVGGMRRGFTLPAEFPALERVSLSLTSGDNPRLTCEAYFALTSNTVQFGAAAHLVAAAHGFSVTGEAGFDVLIQLSPLHFLAEFFAGMQLKRGSSNLFKVKVQGALEGPAPLTVRAKCTFEILWWDVSIRVNATLAQGAAPPRPAAVDVQALLVAQLRDARNWSAELPAERTRTVTLREAAGEGLRVHPLARLTVRQTVVPLNLERDIDSFGDAPVAGQRRFVLGRPTLGGEPVAGEVLRDDFAPAQYFAMSDDDKLAAPQYETLQAGQVFGLPQASFDLGAGLSSALEYETRLVDREAAAEDEAPAPAYRPSDAVLALHALYGAAGRSVLRGVGLRTSKPFAVLGRPGFVVMDEQLAAVTPADARLSFAEARQRARTASVRARAVPAFEPVN